MKVFYSDHYTIPLPEGHRFPIEKYRLLRFALLREGVARDDELHEPPLPSPDTLRLAHTHEYVEAVLNGTLSEFQIRKIGFPYSEALVKRSLATIGGALAAAEEALRNGVSGNLAGGTHHAFANSGEGYCVFNDLAVVTKYLLTVQKIGRAHV